MRRVSSRQRLVSWDAFDATEIINSDGYSSSLEDYNDDLPLALTRKRDRRSNTPTLIPSFSWEIEHNVFFADSHCATFHDMPNDVHLLILSFLNLESIRQVMAVNHKYRRLLLGIDSHSSIWQRLLEQKKWPNHSIPKDELDLPTAVGSYQHNTNLNLLLSMTPSQLPTELDASLIQPRHRRDTQLTLVDTNVVRYTGPIGAGDRCIRANQPFPKPSPRTTPSLFSPKRRSIATPSLLDFICRGAKAAVGKRQDYKPFVAPYLDPNNSLIVTPRMIAYYEVNIQAKHQEDSDDDQRRPSILRPNNRPSECVAVGLATESFHLHTRMPGWDSQSFGYHGDDGGIFHSSGGMVERFGPCFGPGDTVGCGVDYVVKGVFFTLNGKFLGYGWKGLDESLLFQDLYPIVGIDTNATIEMNFGSKPFQYNLSERTLPHKPLIASHYQLLGGKRQEDDGVSTSLKDSRKFSCSSRWSANSTTSSFSFSETIR